MICIPAVRVITASLESAMTSLSNLARSSDEMLWRAKWRIRTLLRRLESTKSGSTVSWGVCIVKANDVGAKKV
jgi:hypothetical protein